eukprot:3896778-Rhodomonas_salina.1
MIQVEADHALPPRPSLSDTTVRINMVWHQHGISASRSLRDSILENRDYRARAPRQGIAYAWTLSALYGASNVDAQCVTVRCTKESSLAVRQLRCHDASPQPLTTCGTQTRDQYLSSGSAIDECLWAGIFALSAGRTYQWTCLAYRAYNGFSATYGYPGPGMDVFITPASSIAAARLGT